jgi:SNF2 family DNA or RNA helicase
MLDRDNLHEYQRQAVAFIQEHKRCGLFLDMGMGKTTSTLTATSDLLDSCAVNKVLVIAPLRVARSVWKQETELWRHLRDLRVSVCVGSKRDRLAALHREADIYTINRENVPWLVEHYGKKWPFDMVVVDESSSFKSSSSLRFKRLRQVLPLTEYMVLLTGTPSPNGLLDLWSQVFLIDLGRTLGRTMTGYKKRFFESDYMGYKFTPKSNADAEIHELIKPFVMSMSAEDYLQVPDRIDLITRVELPKKALDEYQQFERDLFIALDDEEIEAINAAVLAGKLLQMANGAMYTDETKNWALIHDAKINALKDIAEDNAGETMLIAYNFQSDLARLRAAFPDAVQLDNNQSTIDRWNNGEIPMLLAHPASAGHGINLQKGGSLIVWFGLNWSLELYQQFNGRLHRQGQAKPVRVIHLAAADTIDERLLTVLDSKDTTQRALLSALKPKN